VTKEISKREGGRGGRSENPKAEAYLVGFIQSEDSTSIAAALEEK
jgi:hypothetical protein